MITQLSGTTTENIWSTQSYKVPASVFNGATSIVITFEGSGYTYWINDGLLWTAYEENGTASTYTIPNDHLQDVIGNGLIVGMKSAFDTTKVYVKITK